MFVADNEKIRGLPDKKGQANFNDLVMTGSLNAGGINSLNATE